MKLKFYCKNLITDWSQKKGSVKLNIAQQKLSNPNNWEIHIFLNTKFLSELCEYINSFHVCSNEVKEGGREKMR